MRRPLAFQPFAMTFAVASLLAVAATHADPADDLKAKRATAKQYVEAGRAAQEKLSNYDAAVQWFQLAYDLVPEPVLLYNMANADRLGGHDALALDLYERYVAAEPDGVGVADARKWIGPLRTKVDAERARAADEARAAAEAQRAAAEVEKARQAELQVLTEKARAYDQMHTRALTNMDERRRAYELARLQAVAARTSDGYRWTGVGIGAAGVLGLAVGVFYGAKASRLADEVSVTFSTDKFADGARAEKIQIAALTTGGVLIAAGAALVVVDWRLRRSRMRMVPTVTADDAGVAVRGAW